MKFLFAVIFVVKFGMLNGRPDGAPTTACSTLLPIHGNSQPQNTRSPFQITATKSGDKIKVTISGPNSGFQGFVLQARSARNPNRLAEGKFSTEPGQSRTINCNRGQQNTLTHINTAAKSKITTEWMADSNAKTDVIFRATIAKNFYEFWSEVDSPAVRFSDSKQQSDVDTSSKLYDGCSVTKGCFGIPDGCEDMKNCEILMEYVDTGNGVRITMTGSLESSQNYMATGLSTDTNMGDDSVTECFMDNGHVLVQHSRNKRRGNTPIRREPEGMYRGQFKDGVVTCSWVRPYFTIVPTDTDDKIFDLSNATYYIFIARGQMLNGGIGYHSGGKFISGRSANFTAYEPIASQGADDAVKVHGSTYNEDNELVTSEFPETPFSSTRNFDKFQTLSAISTSNPTSDESNSQNNGCKNTHHGTLIPILVIWICFFKSL